MKPRAWACMIAASLTSAAAGSDVASAFQRAGALLARVNGLATMESLSGVRDATDCLEPKTFLSKVRRAFVNHSHGLLITVWLKRVSRMESGDTD